jgi:hypothetical protein
MEHKQIYPVLINHQIIGYYRYVDGIRIIYDQKKKKTDKTLIRFNKQHTDTKLTIEK